MNEKIKIHNKFIGHDQSVFIIAEAGVNHNGRLDLALKLIDKAVEAGADAVKFQTFKAGQVVTGFGKMADYQKKNLKKETSQFQMLKKLELREEFYKPIMEHCKKRKIIFLSTPHGSFDSIDLLDKFKVPAFKFGSGDLNNLPLLKYAAGFGKPMILATGMATLEEVQEAIGVVKKAGNDQIVALHCTTNYPCPLDEVNLLAMQTMMAKLDVLVGYSDHTEGVQVSVMAAVMGACLIEKHFTLDKKMSGPDHRASSDPEELRQVVKEIRNIQKITGSPIKKPNKSEIKMIKEVRKSVVAACVIPAGRIIVQEDLAIKRPGTGLPPKEIDNIIGKKAKRKILEDEFLQKKDYE